MRKMNKLGFTLIEMLVVIAIIAILVSIIVPVVGSSAKRAAAATNAANLRSAAATISIDQLTKGGTFTPGKIDESEYPENFTVPVAKTNGGLEGGAFGAYIENDAVNCYFGDHSVDYYADIAADGKLDDPHAGPGASETPNPSEPNPSEPNPSEPNPSEPNPSEPNPSEPNPSEPNPSEPDPTPTRCGCKEYEAIGLVGEWPNSTYDSTCKKCDHAQHSNRNGGCSVVE